MYETRNGCQIVEAITCVPFHEPPHPVALGMARLREAVRRTLRLAWSLDALNFDSLPADFFGLEAVAGDVGTRVLPGIMYLLEHLDMDLDAILSESEACSAASVYVRNNL